MQLGHHQDVLLHGGPHCPGAPGLRRAEERPADGRLPEGCGLQGFRPRSPRCTRRPKARGTRSGGPHHGPGPCGRRLGLGEARLPGSLRDGPLAGAGGGERGPHACRRRQDRLGPGHDACAGGGAAPRVGAAGLRQAPRLRTARPREPRLGLGHAAARDGEPGGAARRGGARQAPPFPAAGALRPRLGPGDARCGRGALGTGARRGGRGCAGGAQTAGVLQPRLGARKGGGAQGGGGRGGPGPAGACTQGRRPGGQL
mmetsp:Transcript_105901/g.332057  ORF Transcript_105901/g.332057 Transcript_105901/m.332057 type:complete len:257 (+) Transcript_105901:345-1115(+)